MPLLPKSGRRFLKLYAVLLGLLALLDAFSLGLLAVVISPLVSGQPLTLPVIGTVSTTGLIWLLVDHLRIVVILKGILASVLQFYATRRFASYELEIGDRLLAAYLAAPWVERLKRNSADVVRIADYGIANTIAGVLLPAATLIGEAMTFIVVLAVLVIAQPAIAVTALVYLGLVGVVLYFWVSRNSQVAGRVNRDYSFTVSRLLTEMMGALKEITLRNKAGEVAAVVHANRIRTSRARANIQFFGIVPRYVLETALIGGFVLVGVVGYLTTGGIVGSGDGGLGLQPRGFPHGAVDHAVPGDRVGDGGEPAACPQRDRRHPAHGEAAARPRRTASTPVRSPSIRRASNSANVGFTLFAGGGARPARRDPDASRSVPRSRSSGRPARASRPSSTSSSDSSSPPRARSRSTGRRCVTSRPRGTPASATSPRTCRFSTRRSARTSR